MKTSKQKRFAAIFAGMLCISCLTAPFSATAETADTAGENDTLAAAEELPLNTAVSGEISAKGDMDYYKITLPEDGTLQMGMTADWVSGFGESYRVAFYTADGTTVFQDDYVAENIQFPADGWKAGVYYFSVKPEYRTHAAWLMNDRTATVLRKLKDDSGNYLWNSSTDTILGKPIRICNELPDIAAGAKPVLFGDFRYYWIVDRSPVSMKALKERFAMSGRVGYVAFELLDARLVRRDAVKAISVIEESV